MQVTPLAAALLVTCLQVMQGKENRGKGIKLKEKKKEKVNYEQKELDWVLENLPHHREKRFLFMTDEKRLVLPPGTTLVLTPTLALPLLRYPPEGIHANITISTPFTISFDEMGLTDNQNPFGLISFFNPILGTSILGRRKRDERSSLPDPATPPHTITGGERAFLYQWVEDYLFTFGMDGKACLLRAVCEMHESPLLGYGLLGELLEIFLTPSRSAYWKALAEYLEAEERGRHHGDCTHYKPHCTRSLFRLNKYSREAQHPVVEGVGNKSIP